MMTSPRAALFLTLLLVERLAQMSQRVSATQHQDKTFVSATEGGRLILKCIPDPDSTRIHWYKQSLGQKSMLMCTWSRIETNVIYYGEFEDNPRFRMDTYKHHLTISNVSLSDTAFYYCVGWKQVSIELDRIIFVIVMRSGLRTTPLILQSVSKPDRPKDSVTLNCTVHTGSCGEDHSVYWFRESGGSQPGLIYARGGSDDQCQQSDKAKVCEYSLPIESLNLPHKGTYYCAVAACGQIFLGKGTTLEVNNSTDSLLLYCLGAALLLALIAVVCLVYSLYKIRRTTDSVESKAGCSASSAENMTSHQSTDDIHYAALHLNLPRRSRKQRTNPDNECIYSGVNL